MNLRSLIKHSRTQGESSRMDCVCARATADPLALLRSMAALGQEPSPRSPSRMLQEESHHLPRRVRPAGIGERTLSAAAGPSMAAAMHQPVLGQHPSLGGAVQASRVVAPADSALTVDFGGGIRLRGARADHVLAVGGMQPLALARA
jgi:hypothetical protein